VQIGEPLLMEPLYFSYVWGAPNQKSWIASRFGRQIPPEVEPVAESWEIVALDRTLTNRILNYPRSQATLFEVLERDPEAILGILDQSKRFPFIVKYLEIFDRLSVQVHPDDPTAERLGFGPFGKSEAWLILEATPEARIWAGFAQEVSRPIVEDAIKSGEVVTLLREHIPHPGDFYHFPAGTIHAAQGRLLVAEVQEASQLTFRIFDWNRTGKDGQPRPLHVAEALESIAYRGEFVEPVNVFTELRNSPDQRLVRFRRFAVRHRQIAFPLTIPLEGQYSVICLLQGRLKVTVPSCELDVQAGQTFLIPATIPSVTFSPGGGPVPSLLEIRPK
jgi:mannose-6-phosphate isomerase